MRHQLYRLANLNTPANSAHRQRAVNIGAGAAKPCSQDHRLELEEREIVTVQGANGTRDIVDGISDDQLRTWTQAATMAIGLLFIGRALVLLTDAAGSPS